MSSRKEHEGHLIQRVNQYVSVLGKCPVVNHWVSRKEQIDLTVSRKPPLNETRGIFIPYIFMYYTALNLIERLHFLLTCDPLRYRMPLVPANYTSL